MSTTPKIATTPTTTPPARGLQLPCPRCGEADANLLLWLSDASTFTCQECDAEFTADDVRDFMTRWAPALAWIEQIPGGPQLHLVPATPPG